MSLIWLCINDITHVLNCTHWVLLIYLLKKWPFPLFDNHWLRQQLYFIYCSYIDWKIVLNAYEVLTHCRHVLVFLCFVSQTGASSVEFILWLSLLGQQSVEGVFLDLVFYPLAFLYPNCLRDVSLGFALLNRKSSPSRWQWVGKLLLRRFQALTQAF